MKNLCFLLISLGFLNLNGQHEEIYNKYVTLNKGVGNAENLLIEDFRNLQGSVKSIVIYQLDGKEEKYEGGYLGSHGYQFDIEGNIVEKKYFYEKDLPVMQVLFNDHRNRSWYKKVIFNKDGSELYQRDVHYSEDGILIGYNNYSEGKKKDKGKFKLKNQKDSVRVRHGSLASKYFDGKLIARDYHVLSTKLVVASERHEYHDNGALASISEIKKKKTSRQEKYDLQGRLISKFFDFEAANGQWHERINVIYAQKITGQIGAINLYEIVDDGPSSYHDNFFVSPSELKLDVPHFGTIKTSYEYNGDGLLKEKTFEYSDSKIPNTTLLYTYDANKLSQIELLKGDQSIWTKSIAYNSYGDIVSIKENEGNRTVKKIDYVSHDSNGNWTKRIVTNQRSEKRVFERQIEYFN